MAFTPSELDLLAVRPSILAVKVFLSPAPLLEADRESASLSTPWNRLINRYGEAVKEIPSS